MADTVDRSTYFTRHELACRHTGLCLMDKEFMEALDRLRLAYGSPMILSSAYRDPSHPEEAGKKTTGYHPKGRAVDVLVSGRDAHRLVGLAIMAGFGGIGISQKGPHGGRFVHLDNRSAATIWSY
jgi:zinc D-Ala-D-Ala carboxypeptidase